MRAILVGVVNQESGVATQEVMESYCQSNDAFWDGEPKSLGRDPKLGNPISMRAILVGAVNP